MQDEYIGGTTKDDHEEGEVPYINDFGITSLFNNQFKQLLPSKILLLEDQNHSFLLEYKDPRKMSFVYKLLKQSEQFNNKSDSISQVYDNRMSSES